MLHTKSIREFLDHDLFEQKTRKIPNQLHYFGHPSEIQNYQIAILTVKSAFFNELLSCQNWTDIEKFYFEELTSKFKEHNDNKVQLKKEIFNLNRDFEHLKTRLITYLKKINLTQKNNSFGYILEELLEKPSLEYLKRFFKIEDTEYNDFKIFKTVFLNFNYTSTLQYFYRFNFDKIKYIPIHGNIDDPESIIFGYGDDSNEHYKALENYDMKELLEHIKSFYYPSQKHYIDLMNIIDSDDFDVIVLGHSLGLSDRVLLESIFENDKCKAIRLFHRGKKSHFDKLIALSRHFKNKQKMRNKIVDIYTNRDLLGELKE